MARAVLEVSAQAVPPGAQLGQLLLLQVQQPRVPLAGAGRECPEIGGAVCLGLGDRRVQVGIGRPPGGRSVRHVTRPRARIRRRRRRPPAAPRASDSGGRRASVIWSRANAARVSRPRALRLSAWSTHRPRSVSALTISSSSRSSERPRGWDGRAGFGWDMMASPRSTGRARAAGPAGAHNGKVPARLRSRPRHRVGRRSPSAEARGRCYRADRTRLSPIPASYEEPDVARRAPRAARRDRRGSASGRRGRRLDGSDPASRAPRFGRIVGAGAGFVPPVYAVAGRGCSRKKRSISREASGPLGSV